MFENSNVWIQVGQNISPRKILLEKLKFLDWLSEFYTTLLFLSDIGANSFAYFQLGASNSDKDKYLKNRRISNQYEIVQYENKKD